MYIVPSKLCHISVVGFVNVDWKCDIVALWIINVAVARGREHQVVAPEIGRVLLRPVNGTVTSTATHELQKVVQR